MRRKFVKKYWYKNKSFAIVCVLSSTIFTKQITRAVVSSPYFFYLLKNCLFLFFHVFLLMCRCKRAGWFNSSASVDTFLANIGCIAVHSCHIIVTFHLSRLRCNWSIYNVRMVASMASSFARHYAGSATERSYSSVEDWKYSDELFQAVYLIAAIDCKKFGGFSTTSKCGTE